MAWATDKTSIGTAVSNTTYGATTLPYTTNTAVASNAWIFVGIISYFSDTVSTITDNGPGLTWSVTKVTGTADSSQQVAIGRAWAPAGMASGTVITATWTGGDVDSKAMAGSSFTGGDASSFDAAATVGSATSVNWSTASLTTAQNDELLFAAGRAANAATGTIVSPSVELFDTATTIGDTLYIAYRVAGAAGGYTVATTLSGAEAWTALAVAMKVAAGGGTNATVTGVAAASTASVVAPPKPRPTAPFSEINVRM